MPSYYRKRTVNKKDEDNINKAINRHCSPPKKKINFDRGLKAANIKSNIFIKPSFTWNQFNQNPEHRIQFQSQRTIPSMPNHPGVEKRRVSRFNVGPQGMSHHNWEAVQHSNRYRAKRFDIPNEHTMAVGNGNTWPYHFPINGNIGEDTQHSSYFLNSSGFDHTFVASPTCYIKSLPVNYTVSHQNQSPPPNFVSSYASYNAQLQGHSFATPKYFNGPSGYFNAPPENYIAPSFRPTKNIARSSFGSALPPNMGYMQEHHLGSVQPQRLRPKAFQRSFMNHERFSNSNFFKPVYNHGSFEYNVVIDEPKLAPPDQPMVNVVSHQELSKNPASDNEPILICGQKETINPINEALAREDVRISNEMETPTIPDVLVTTKLYISGLSVPFTDDLVKNTFGSYGPLLGWNVNQITETTEKGICGHSFSAEGFVHFSSRKDAERCIVGMNDQLFGTRKLKISFASEKNKKDERKIIYYPESLIQYLPNMSDTGMLFNCETGSHLLEKGMGNFVCGNDLKSLTNLNELNKPEYATSFLDLHKKSYVKVLIPDNERVLLRIHQLVRIGLVPEYCGFHNIISQIISNKTMMVYESNEEEISTLNIIRPGTIENNYLLWKCYSIACGESIDKWSTKGVRIFEKGPIFVPPSPKFKLWKGMPEFLYKTAFNYKEPTAEELGDRRLLNGGDKEKLKRILENTDLSHDQIAKDCTFLVEHVGECKDVIGQIKNTLTSLNVPFVCINICYIISDVMFYARNCKEQNLQPYLVEFGIEIEFIFGLIFKYYDSLTCQEVKSNLRVKITKVLYFWGNKEIFDSQLILKFINKLHNINKDMPECLSNKKKSVPQTKTILPTKPREPTADISHHQRVTNFNKYLKKI